MATTASLSSLCSPLTTRLSHLRQAPTPLCFSKTHLSFLSLTTFLSPHGLSSLSLSSSSPTAPTLSFVPKLSETESPVIESEPQSEIETEPEPEPESLQVVETTSEEEPIHEDVFAVVMIGGRQYIVIPGRYIYTQRLKGANVNDKVVLNKVLLVSTKKSTYIGQPLVPDAVVHAVVEEQGLNDKVRVFKYKKKKNYRRNIGHRQPNTRLRIIGITGYQNSPAVTLA